MSPLAVRVAALLGAIAMVVGAVVIRNRINDNNAGRNETLELWCAQELDEVCNDIADTDEARVTVTVEDASATADRLTEAGAADFDGWLTFDPFPQMVEQAREAQSRSRLFDRVSQPIARSPVSLVMWKERAAALSSRCKGPVNWTCLGEAADNPWKSAGGRDQWGAVKTAIPDPSITGTGLLALGGATAAFAGTTDVSRVELEENDTFGVWLANLKHSQVPGADLARMLAGGPAIVDAVAALEAQTRPVLRSAANAGQVDTIYPSPVATADVVLGTVASQRSARLAELVEGKAGQDALARAEWKTANAGLPPGNGLPDPGLLAYLREAWRNVQ